MKKAGCRKIYSEQISRSKTNRPEPDKMMTQLHEGDVDVVWNLDHLGRNLSGLINLIGYFQSNRVGFKSRQDNIDTTTPTGRLTFYLFAALADT